MEIQHDTSLAELLQAVGVKLDPLNPLTFPKDIKLLYLNGPLGLPTQWGIFEKYLQINHFPVALHWYQSLGRVSRMNDRARRGVIAKPHFEQEHYKEAVKNGDLKTKYREFRAWYTSELYKFLRASNPSERYADMLAERRGDIRSYRITVKGNITASRNLALDFKQLEDGQLELARALDAIVAWDHAPTNFDPSKGKLRFGTGKTTHGEHVMHMVTAVDALRSARSQVMQVAEEALALLEQSRHEPDQLAMKTVDRAGAMVSAAVDEMLEALQVLLKECDKAGTAYYSWAKHHQNKVMREQADDELIQLARQTRDSGINVGMTFGALIVTATTAGLGLIPYFACCTGAKLCVKAYDKYDDYELLDEQRRDRSIDTLVEHTKLARPGTNKKDRAARGVRNAGQFFTTVSDLAGALGDLSGLPISNAVWITSVTVDASLSTTDKIDGSTHTKVQHDHHDDALEYVLSGQVHQVPHERNRIAPEERFDEVALRLIHENWDTDLGVPAALKAYLAKHMPNFPHDDEMLFEGCTSFTSTPEVGWYECVLTVDVNVRGLNEFFMDVRLFVSSEGLISDLSVARGAQIESSRWWNTTLDHQNWNDAARKWVESLPWGIRLFLAILEHEVHSGAFELAIVSYQGVADENVIRAEVKNHEVAEYLLKHQENFGK